MTTRALRLLLGVILGTVPLAGCVVYEVPATPSPSTYDRAWSAAVGGLQDAGVHPVLRPSTPAPLPPLRPSLPPAQ
jgi:hypothetical protein